MLLRIAWITLATAIFAGAPAAAGWWASAHLTSDYVARGFSRTAGSPALQAGVRYQARSGLVAGLWGSNVDFDFGAGLDDSREVELQGFAGWGTELGEAWSLSLLGLRYHYPDSGLTGDGSYNEARVTLLYRQLLRMSLAYTDDFLGGGGTPLFAEISTRYPLPRFVDLTAGLGHGRFSSRREVDYSYGHLGAARALGRWDLGLAYYWSDSRPIPPWGEVIDGSWVLSVSVRLLKSQ